MFGKYGEFDSWEEIARALKAQQAEGDMDAVKSIAEENGLDMEDVEAYLDGVETDMVMCKLAAYGKLAVEEKEHKVNGMLSDWVDIIRDAATSSDELAAGIRRKGKKLSEVLARCIDASLESKCIVDKSITGLCCAEIRQHTQNHPLTIGGTPKRKVLEIVREYYCPETMKPHKHLNGTAAGGRS